MGTNTTSARRREGVWDLVPAPMMDLRAEIERRLARLPGFRPGPPRRGHGSPFAVGGVELVHFHGSDRMDVRLGRGAIGAGRAAGTLDRRLKTRGPSADWASLPLTDLASVELGVRLAEEAALATLVPDRAPPPSARRPRRRA